MIGIACTVVHKDFRQKGIFRGMLELVEDKAPDKGVRALKLSVHQQNQDALHAYAKSGFLPETMGMIKRIE